MSPEKRKKALELLEKLFVKLDAIAKVGDRAWSQEDTERQKEEPDDTERKREQPGDTEVLLAKPVENQNRDIIDYLNELSFDDYQIFCFEGM